MKGKTLKFLIKLSESNILEIIFVAIVFWGLIIFKIFLKQDLELFDTTTFSSMLIATGLTAVVKIIKYFLMNKIEDSAKLESDFNKLKKIYCLDEFVSSKENPSDDNIIPIIKSADLSGKKIIINDNKNSKYQPPEFINNNYSKLIDAHKTSSIYNNLNIRVKDWQIIDNSFVIQTERTTYFNSLATNRAMDYKINDNLTVRSLFEQGPLLTPLKYSQLSNHLGFNGMIESSDNYFFLILRKNNLSIAKGTYGNSVSASLKTKYALDENGCFQTDGLFNSLKKEISDETGINANLSDIKLVSAYRDVLEGGKPQLFFYYKSSLSMNEINLLFSRTAKKSPEKYKRKKNISNVKSDGTKLVWIHKKTLLDEKKTEIFYNKIETYSLNDKHISLPMFPNSAACIVFLIDYLKKGDLK